MKQLKPPSPLLLKTTPHPPIFASLKGEYLLVGGGGGGWGGVFLSRVPGLYPYGHTFERFFKVALI